MKLNLESEMDRSSTSEDLSCLTRLPLLRPLNLESPDERRLWRACELCSFLEYRFPEHPDPRALSDPAIENWARRGLTAGEQVEDPIGMTLYRPFWIIADGEPVGTVAAMLQDTGWNRPLLEIASLYLFAEQRRRGHAGQVMDALEQVVAALDLRGLRLDTDWLWQPAVRFYLRRRFWVMNWKRGLSLGRYRADPDYRLESHPGQMMLRLADQKGPIITAERDGERLRWREDPPADESAADDERLRWPLRSTLSLHLAVAGWPLVRGPAEWADRHRWSDLGMPEGLAYKITLFEAHARRHGFRVETPRTPGFRVPTNRETLSGGAQHRRSDRNAI